MEFIETAFNQKIADTIQTQVSVEYILVLRWG